MEAERMDMKFVMSQNNVMLAESQIFYSCEHCDANFQDKDDYEAHKQTHKKDPPTPVLQFVLNTGTQGGSQVCQDWVRTSY